MGNIRWLHLSDFHVGKDKYGERQLFKYILKHVGQKEPPNFVFITGDITNAGTKAQYDEFALEFLMPLEKKAGDNCKIFVVPGNHDVDRSQQKFVSREAIQQKSLEFFDPTSIGLNERKEILPRFSAYGEQYFSKVNGKDSWLDSSEGCFVYSSTVKSIQIGVLGLNTAWFAEDNQDEKHLTPGKAIVEIGLEKIADAQLKIVLGHHPLDWFKPDDAQAIRSLFGKNQVIYLHGHLHKNRSHLEEGSGNFLLNVQSGAAFQAREGEIWVNGLLWAEVNLSEQRLELEPYSWSKEHQGWSPDGHAFPPNYQIEGTTRWSLPLPGSLSGLLRTQDIAKKGGKPEKHFVPPEGWEVIHFEYLEKIDKNPDEKLILSYFDGRIPSWGLALCPTIPRRGVVKEIAERLDSALQGGHPFINMILGAGGEGKSTALLQIIEKVLQSGKPWQVVHRRGDNIQLTRKMVDELPKDGHYWLIASDDADLIAEEAYWITVGLQTIGRSDVHFLLSAALVHKCHVQLSWSSVNH